MKLVDIKGNINPKQRLILIITILLLLIVILGILKATGKIDFIQQDSVIHVKRQLKQRL